MTLDTIRTVAVLGAGTMGNGIAHVFARSGYNVILRDVEARFLDAAMRDHRKEPRPRNQERKNRRRRQTQNSRAHSRHRRFFGNCPRRFRRRSRARTPGPEAVGLAGSGPAAASRSHSRVQYVVDFGDHSGRRHQPPGPFHRHALHESGSGDGARRSDPRAANQRRHVSHARWRSASNSKRNPWP